ncbi:spore coat U domain-containing protein [Bradyrhizobium sp. LHD-71]|nr:spore coat U domain-containing protein [Bradyrhizobium sp. LHD-71]MDQ8729440.1 spore coat U domain-containing protein [Bradyrhizobium sp. LHD-71]
MLCALAGLGVVAIVVPQRAHAATATGQFTVRITIAAECRVNSATDLDFGTSGVIAANVDAQSTVTVQCTNTTPYTVGINAGTGSGATIANRRMSGPGGATLGYAVYRDTARTQVWGVTVGTDTLAGTGNGNAQAIPVYGRVPAQATPAAGAYTDTLTITVTY